MDLTDFHCNYLDKLSLENNNLFLYFWIFPSGGDGGGWDGVGEGVPSPIAKNLLTPPPHLEKFGPK